MEKTICLLNDYLGIREQQNITRDLNLFVALILECTAVDLNLSETQRDDFLSKFESVARGMCLDGVSPSVFRCTSTWECNEVPK